MSAYPATNPQGGAHHAADHLLQRQLHSRPRPALHRAPRLHRRPAMRHVPQAAERAGLQGAYECE
jgi:hypothetical protein